MAIYRTIHISYWQDKFILSLTPEQKYFYIYLMTNSKTKQCGSYELPLNVVSFETGYNLETVKKLFEYFEGVGKILYDTKTEEIFMVNWFKYNPVGNINILKCIIKETGDIKSQDFVERIINTLENGILSENLLKCLREGRGLQGAYKQMVRNKHKHQHKHQHNNKKKQLSPEDTPAIVKHDYIEEIISAFRRLYLLNKKEEYISIGNNGLSAGKDRKAVGQLLRAIKSFYPDEDSQQIIQRFINLFTICFSITDQWLSKNMTLSIINSKLNEIIQYAKSTSNNGRSKIERELDLNAKAKQSITAYQAAE